MAAGVVMGVDGALAGTEVVSLTLNTAFPGTTSVALGTDIVAW